MSVSVGNSDATCWEVINQEIERGQQSKLNQVEERMEGHSESAVQVKPDHSDWVGLKPSINEPPNLELKSLSSHLVYAFLEVDGKLLVIISSCLKACKKEKLLEMLKRRKRAIAWKIVDIWGINPSFCTHIDVLLQV